jgi:arylsulfatase
MKRAILPLLLLLLTPPFADAAPRPNIVIIMSDDMGFSDLGCYGGEIETPNLDALAMNGVRFTQFYNTARCCPTRAALLTGLYSHQAGIGHMVDPWSAKAGDAYAGDLSPSAVTIAEALHTSGYRSYMTGKWHVTKETRPAGEEGKYNWPLQRGFDRFYGTITGAGSFFDPATLVRDNRPISAAADDYYKPASYYYTDAISDHAVEFVTDHRTRHPSTPFFLYVAYTAAHWPMHAKAADIQKYAGRYDRGYDNIRAARVEKMRRLGIIDPTWKVTPTSEDWSNVANKQWETRCMEVYAAMVDCMDQGIGRLVEALTKNGQIDNTLILFLQDNGGCAEPMGRKKNSSERPLNPTLPIIPAEALQTNSVPKQTRDGYPVRQGEGVMPGPADTYIGYGLGWANVSNTPFREFKHWEHEGGISTPLIAHWPSGISAPRRGSLEKQPAHLIDLMATCIDLSGSSYPTERSGMKVKPYEGVSLAPALAGTPLQRPQPIFWEHEGNRAIRDGRWKLVSKHNRPWELYDMESDRTETEDLSATHADRAQAMAKTWEDWATRVGVKPWPIAVKHQPR